MRWAPRFICWNAGEGKDYAGINQNYAWGQDSWTDFSAAMSVLKPDATITTSQMPKFGAGQYGAEISALLQSNSDVIHSSLWGGDLEAFMLQSMPRDLYKKSQLVLVAGEPYLQRLGTPFPTARSSAHAARTECSRRIARSMPG